MLRNKDINRNMRHIYISSIMTDSDETIIPAKFSSIIRDFTRDLTTTFPEYSILWRKWTTEDQSPKEFEKLFKYCTEVYPERFFDILYQNDEIFQDESDTNTRFLPAVEFKLLYNCAGITDTTKRAIWKYLQLIMMTVLNSVRDKSAFGDAANMFEGVDEDVLHEKLNQTLGEIGEFFRGLGEETQPSATADTTAEADTASSADDAPETNPFGLPKDMPGMDEFRKMFEQMRPGGDASGSEMPNANDLHEHLKGLFDGKIGNLAKELAAEITQDVENIFEGESADIRSTGDLIKNIMKNPKKVMGLMKTISGKLQQKMKSGEISEEEIMKEAGDIMGKMKGMKGMGQMNDMFKNLAKGMGGGAALNVGSMQKMQRQMATKERMLAKMEEKREAAAAAASEARKHIERTSDPTRAVFRMNGEDAQEYSVAPATKQDESPAFSDTELVEMFTDKKDPSASKPKKSNKKKHAK